MKKILSIFSILIIAVSCSPKTSGSVVPVVQEEAMLPTLELKEGKSIFDSKCSRCHAPVIIDNYTQERWNKILPDMARRAKLSVENTALVQAYVSWELNN